MNFCFKPSGSKGRKMAVSVFIIKNSAYFTSNEDNCGLPDNFSISNRLGLSTLISRNLLILITFWISASDDDVSNIESSLSISSASDVSWSTCWCDSFLKSRSYAFAFASRSLSRDSRTRVFRRGLLK
ncbi:hypothetical protein OGAPHI_000191 [Ogataea philodendri]|uniref:Uncharacterized protein n=1 Tax=Ogataea philodendri TaxID=1378263 RepID=A0A9P8PHS8_9ASCO|nr:uncharacterized protein OGAPHI_000191 [Ogataea philodendri]KAH3671489.1 hypothetical protein OGAPHI_000191 [Ogataea philodendri]